MHTTTNDELHDAIVRNNDLIRSLIDARAAFDCPARAARHSELLDDARVDSRRDRWQRVRRHVRIDVGSL